MALDLDQRREQQQSLVRQLDTLVELAERQLHVSFEGIDSPSGDRLGQDPLLTHRQRYLVACFNFWGVIGLGRAIYTIAGAEDLDEAIRRAEHRAEEARKKANAKKRKRSARVHGGRRKRVGPVRVVPDSSSSEDENDSNTTGTTPNPWREALEEYKIGDKLDAAIAGHKSWTMVIDDYNVGVYSRLLFYNSSVGPEALESILMGDLPRRMQEDQDFNSRVGKLVKCRKAPGTYFICVAIGCPSRSTQCDDVNVEDLAGLSLSPNQFDIVLDTIDQYMKIGDAASESLAHKIDHQLPNCPSDIDYSWQRRYAGGDRDDFTNHIDWAANFRAEFLDPLKTALEADNKEAFDGQLRRCLAYARLAQNVLDRVTEHWSHGVKESPLFGLFTATCCHCFGDAFSWEEYSYQVYKTVAVDDIGLDEIGTTMITSAYPWDCGLSYVHAGCNLGYRKNWKKQDFLEKLEANAASIQKSGMLDRSIEDAKDKIERLQRLRDFETSAPTLFAEFQADAEAVYSDISDLLRWTRVDLAHTVGDQDDEARVLEEYNEAFGGA